MKLDALIPLVENLGKLFGPNCEVILHDFTKDIDHSILHVVNGHVTGRNLNSPATNFWFDKDKVHLSASDTVYNTITPFGHVLRSISSNIVDEDGKICGAICVNYDITDALESQKFLSSITGSILQNDLNTNESHQETFFKNVNEMLSYYIREIEKQKGKPASEMNKAERQEAIIFLKEKGVLDIKNIRSKLCEIFGISRYTLYHDLDELEIKLD